MTKVESVQTEGLMLAEVFNSFAAINSNLKGNGDQELGDNGGVSVPSINVIRV
jgi:hypothetical protein